MKRWILAAALCAVPSALFSQEDGKEDETARALERVLQKLRKKVAPTAVAVDVDRIKDPEGSGPTGGAGTGRDYYSRPKGPTTGTIVSEDGYILTSYFNISGELRSITVTLWDGTKHRADLLGFDAGKDIAMLKIDAQDLPVLPKAKLADLKQGDFVAVIGRSPDPATPTVNFGVLSAKKRRKNTAVQTDAELNYGNVGGPLVTLKGELIGVASHIRPREPWGQSGGVGFATHVDAIDSVFEKLKKKTTQIKESRGPWAGFEAADLPKDFDGGFKGILVERVVPESPAEDAGMQEGDVLVEFGGKAFSNMEEYNELLFKTEIGQSVAIKARRRRDKESPWVDVELTVELAEHPQ